MIVVSPYFSAQRENASAFLKMVKNLSISYDFCKKRHLF